METYYEKCTRQQQKKKRGYDEMLANGIIEEQGGYPMLGGRKVVPDLNEPMTDMMFYATKSFSSLRTDGDDPLVWYKVTNMLGAAIDVKILHLSELPQWIQKKLTDDDHTRTRSLSKNRWSCMFQADKKPFAALTLPQTMEEEPDNRPAPKKQATLGRTRGQTTAAPIAPEVIQARKRKAEEDAEDVVEFEAVMSSMKRAKIRNGFKQIGSTRARPRLRLLSWPSYSEGGDIDAALPGATGGTTMREMMETHAPKTLKAMQSSASPSNSDAVKEVPEEDTEEVTSANSKATIEAIQASLLDQLEALARMKGSKDGISKTQRRRYQSLSRRARLERSR